jgi:hypothetical protein
MEAKRSRPRCPGVRTLEKFLSDLRKDGTLPQLRARSTGLNNNIWIGPRGRARHAARIKVQMDHREQFDFGNLAVVSVEDDPPQIKEGSLVAADLALIQRYIALNRQAILDHWNETTDGVELAHAVRPLDPCPR